MDTEIVGNTFLILRKIVNDQAYIDMYLIVYVYIESYCFVKQLYGQ